jgi:hypothetical protein
MSSPEQQIFLLSTLLQLEREARQAVNFKEFAFVAVNETKRLLNYRQAILWQRGINGKPKIAAVSGLDNPDRNSPYLSWLQKLFAFIDKCPDRDKCHLINPAELPPELKEDWQEWLAGPVLWCPLLTLNQRFPGGLFFSAETSWDESQIAVMERLAEAYAHAWTALKGSKPGLLRRLPRAWGKLSLQVVIVMLLIFVLDQSVHLSVLAPVEIVPSEPFLVTAPLNGVIRQFHVKPNQEITKGQLLFSLDDTVLRNDYEVAKKSLAVVRAEYQRITQKAFGDSSSRGQIHNLEAEIARKKAEVSYMADLLKQGEIKAERSGIAIFGDVNDWLGKPVTVGEKVLTIADPGRLEADVRLAVEDAINLEPGAEVLIFLNIKPDTPLHGTLSQASYEAQLTPQGILAFRLKVSLDNDRKLPRIGLRGTAKIYGSKVPVYYYLLRRPLITVRQTLGI